MSYIAPLRCEDCGEIIQKKFKAKTPKYCAGCRRRRQDNWKEQVKTSRQRRVRGH